MFKPAVSAFLLLALLALAQGHSFKKIDFHNGERLLEDASLKRITAAPGYISNAVVRADFGADFNTTNTIGDKPTDMLIWISTNVTGFLSSGQSYFNTFECNELWCKNATSSSYLNKFENPYLKCSSGILFNLDFNLINADGSKPWKLKTTAFSATWGSTYTANSPYYDFDHNNGITNRTYGWIGLGIDGDAIKNFEAAEPIFSVQMGAKAGQGSIIFGKDTTLFKSSVTPQVFTSDGNWTMKVKNFTLGNLINNTQNTYANVVVFDMNVEYIGIPSYTLKSGHYFSYDFKEQFYKYNSSLVANTTDGYTYNGDISKLPDFIVGLTNDKNLTISPYVYMKAVEGFSGHYVHRFKEINSNSNGDSKYYVVLGAPVLRSYYTVFNKLKEGEPTITMYPIYETTSTTTTTSSNTLLYIVIGVVVAIVLVGLVLLKGKGATSASISMLKKPSSGLELR